MNNSTPASADTKHGSAFARAMRTVGVVLGGFIVLGMGLGIVINSYQLPLWVAPVLSLVVFAGSVEFLLAEMIATGTPLGAIALMTLLVNSRHLIYGLSFPLINVRGFWAKLYAVYSLCDEAFALNTGPDKHRLSGAYILWVHASLHLTWAAGTTTGYILGAGFLSHLEGVDFVMTALFTVLAIDAYRANPDKITALVALISGAIGIALAPGSMLLVAMSVYLALLITRFFIARKRGTLPVHESTDQVPDGLEEKYHD